MSMYYRLLNRQYSIAIYENPDDKSYVASCQVFVYGDRGFMYNINGSKFYKCFSTKEQVSSLFKDLGVVSLEGYSLVSHAKLMKLVLRNFATIELLQSGKINDIDVVWVVIKLKEGDNGTEL